MSHTQPLAIALISILGIFPTPIVLANSSDAPAFPSRSVTIKVPPAMFAPSQVMATIAESSGLSEATISVCNLSEQCLSYRGDLPPQSAASLIKVPIALVLLHKLSAENISLETPIYIDPSNFTEEDFAEIKVGKSYPLKYLLTQMIAYSSNIAANQIIDYLGWDYLNQVLGNLGYSSTRVSHKLTGSVTDPTRNRGWAPNLITGNELTDMMVQVYNHHHQEYEVLTDILSHQADRVLGFKGLQASAGHWLGEKTGENALVRGTTLAVKVADKVYVITVTQNDDSSDSKIRRCLAKIVEYLANNGEI